MTLPAEPHGLLYITVHPAHVSPTVLAPVDAAVLLGSGAPEALVELTDAQGIAPPRSLPKLGPGQALLWNRGNAKEANDVVVFEGNTPQAERRRHVRKYATGELEPQKSFFFRGPAKKLNLRAHNLAMFMQIADGIDDETWEFHRRTRDYSQWFVESIKDEELGEEARAVEEDTSLSADESRRRIREAIEKRYTAAA